MKKKTTSTRTTIKHLMKKKKLNYRDISYEECINEIANVLKTKNNIFLDDFIKIKIKKVKPRKIICNLALTGKKKVFLLNRTEKIFIYPTEKFKELIFRNRNLK